MISTTDLMKGHHILTEIVPDGHGRMVKRQVLFFRANKVITLLQERNTHLQEINDRLAKVVEKHKARKALLDEAERIIVKTDCRCNWVHDELFLCYRCAWLEDMKKEMANGGT